MNFDLKRKQLLHNIYKTVLSDPIILLSSEYLKLQQEIYSYRYNKQKIDI